MTRSRRRRRSATLLLTAALIGQACGAPNQPSGSEGAPSQATTSAPASTGPFEPLLWPPDADAPCDEVQAPDAEHGAYTGAIRRIRAIDPATVTFELCDPDVAFPTRIALIPFAINDTGWLESHVEAGGSGEQAIASAPNGTGPYRMENWNRGSDMSLVRNDAYWGTAASNERLILRWGMDASGRTDEVRSGAVDGADDLGTLGLDAAADDIELKAVPRAGLNTFYVGFNNTFAPFDKVKVRLAIALGLDREKIVASFYPPGSEVATHFSPCAITFGCTGDPWYGFNPSAARQLLVEAGYPDGFATTIQYRDVARPYLPDPTAVATEIQAQLLANLNITAELEVMPEETFLSTVDQGGADGIHLLGRSASVPEISDLLDPHFGAGATREFGDPIDAIVDALTTGATTIDETARTTAYTEANAGLRSNVPMIPIAHAGSLPVFRADVEPATTSPLRAERFATMRPGDRRQFVWLAADEPEGLYCADETSSVAHLACAQLSEGLLAFDAGSAAVRAALATSCEPVPELTSWTCTLRSGVAFHDGATLDANDVVLSFAAAWDADHRLHAGRTGDFQPFIDAFGGVLNPPAS